MAKIGHFASVGAPVKLHATGADLYSRFQAEPETLVIAVVDDLDRPVGLIERNAFTLKMAAEFGRALYAHRPVTTFMKAEPRVLEADADAETLFQSLDASGLSGLLDGFVITADGVYAGVGAGVHVLQASRAIHQRRADDMTALAAKLALAEQAASASSRAKTEFLAVMSHEIRTPLNGVLGVAGLMERRLTQPELIPYVRTILDSGESLLRLLTDALDMSRAEAGLMSFEAGPVDLARLASDLKALWTPRAEEKALNLIVACEAGAHVWVEGDETRLKQLFNNLIGNALKFTDTGMIEVRIRAAEVFGKVVLSATVDDSGPGIPDQAITRIFEPFNTGEIGRVGAGAGLGLAICRQIVEGMNGQISASRSPHGGARFEFDVQLPAAAAKSDPSPTPHVGSATAEALHVLIVDDNPTNRFVASKVVELFGCTSSCAGDGQEALDVLERQSFDLILMDVKMPVMDGLTATRQIRRLRSPTARTPILALTANVGQADQEACLAAGMDAVAQKPIVPEALLRSIRAVIGDSRAEARAA